MYILPLGTTITKEIIDDAIAYNQLSKSILDENEDFYLGEHSILSRIRSQYAKNNRIVINHAKYIVDIATGYLVGNPCEYQSKYDDISAFKEELAKQPIAEIDNKVVKGMSRLGWYYEYTYIVGNEVKTVQIDPRSAIIIYDDTIESNPIAGITHFTDKRTGTTKIIVSTPSTIDHYSKGKDGNVILEFSEFNPFGMVPMVEYENNDERQSDFHQVKTLIDGYNTLQSDRLNDKEQLVDAILMFKGFGLDKDQMQGLRANRAIKIPEGGDMQYLIKQLNEADADTLRKIFEQDIFKISMTPNMTDENFVGNASGVAIRYKLLPFEQMIKNKERKFEEGLKQRFAIYNAYLSAIGVMPKIDKYKIDVVFKRTLPQNDFETSQMINNLMDIIDRETLISQLSFVKDANMIIEKKEKEKEELDVTENYGSSPYDVQKLSDDMLKEQIKSVVND